jgi:putative ABC transport system permease protein
MTMQGSLLYGYTYSTSALIDAIEADIWIVARGTVAFDYAAQFNERLAWIAPGTPGVAKTGRALSSQVQIKTPNGDPFAVIALGVDRDFRGRIPDARATLAPPATFGTVAAVDESNLRALGVSTLPFTIEVGGSRVDVIMLSRGFANVIGTPYLFSELADVRRFLARGQPLVNFVLVRVSPGYSVTAVRDGLRERFPNYDVWTKEEFAFRSRKHWLIDTGVGGALLLAAALAFLIGVSVVAQTIYSQTSEHVEEYATLRAMGASNWYVISIVLCQALICGTVGVVLGLLAADRVYVIAQRSMAWILLPIWLKVMVVMAVALMCIFAAIVGARPATSVEPARVFRA